MTTITLCERELADYMLRMTGEKGSIALFSENGASFLEEHYTIDVTGGRGSIRRTARARCCSEYTIFCGAAGAAFSARGRPAR